MYFGCFQKPSGEPFVGLCQSLNPWANIGVHVMYSLDEKKCGNNTVTSFLFFFFDI